jgi:hypothetical protein
MSSAQSWIQGGIIYFVGLFIFISLVYNAGGFDSSFSSNYGSITVIESNTINTSSSNVPTSFSGSKSYFGTIFSFFVWNFSFNTGVLSNSLYLFIIRTIFVYLPLIFLALSFWYSTALSSGGG